MATSAWTKTIEVSLQTASYSVFLLTNRPRILTARPVRVSKPTQDLLDQSLCCRLVVIFIVDGVNELLNKAPARLSLFFNVFWGLRPAKLYENRSTSDESELNDANFFDLSTTQFATQGFSTLSVRA